MLAAVPNRTLARALWLASALLLAPHVTSLASAEPSKEDQAKVKPSIKVELKLEDGQVLQKAGQIGDWGQDLAVVLDAKGHSHAVSIKVSKADAKGDKLKVELSYKRDSTPVIAPFTYDTKPRKRDIIRTDGGLAIAVTVTPKKVTPKGRSRDDSVEKPKDPDDPLDGLE